jgi:hypothetical protein
VLAVVAVALVLAVAKPWDRLAPSASAPERQDAPPPTAPAVTRPPPSPASWTDLGAHLACFSERTWMAVVDLVDGPTVARSWTRIDPVPVLGPADLLIARTHVYAEAVTRIGFCAPAGTLAGRAGFAGAAGTTFDVRAWRMDLEELGAGVGRAVPLVPVLVAGGTLADGGALYIPPPVATPGGIDGGPAPTMPGAPMASSGPSGDGAATRAGSWPAGRYVFRVRLAGAGPGGSDEVWLAIEVRGPWRGFAGEPPPSASPTASPPPSASPPYSRRSP